MKKSEEFKKTAKKLLEAPDLVQETDDARVPDLSIVRVTEVENIMINHRQVHIKKMQKKRKGIVDHPLVAAAAVVTVPRRAETL